MKPSTVRSARRWRNVVAWKIPGSPSSRLNDVLGPFETVSVMGQRRAQDAAMPDA
ncbi:MAG: hypothetical protein ACRD1P_03365 [Thermoanaerobaculia bacterium]